MMIKRLLLIVMTAGTLLATAMPATAAAFDPFGGACTQNGTGGSAVCSDSNNLTQCQSANQSSSQNSNTTCNPISGKHGLLIKITQIVAFAAGAAAVIMIVIGGLRYITSAGNTEKANSARSTVINSLIGLVIIVLAASLITYVVEQL